MDLAMLDTSGIDQSPNQPGGRQSTPDFLAGGGEVGARLRALDWQANPLGVPEAWPQSLKTIVRMMLDSRYAMWMLWGPELTFFCNDAYLPTVGIKRDWVLGARSDKVWEEIWSDIGPRIEQVLERAQATWDEGLLLFLERSGFAEETYHTFSYSPVYDDHNRVAGMLCVVTEVTERVIGERRLRVLADLASPQAGVEGVDAVCRHACDVLAKYPFDVPFAAVYRVNAASQLAHCVARTRALDDTVPAALSSAPSPTPTASGMAPRSAAIVVIMIGRKRSTAASWIASRGERPRPRSASSAKSIIRIAFFFTMPISRITPISAIIENSILKRSSASSAPTPAEGSVDRIVIGWIVLSYRIPSTM
jgi:hypothetical protein